MHKDDIQHLWLAYWHDTADFETPLYPFGVILLLMKCNINKANMPQNKVNL